MSSQNPDRYDISPDKFIKVYVTPLKGQKRPFWAFPEFR